MNPKRLQFRSARPPGFRLRRRPRQLVAWPLASHALSRRQLLVAGSAGLLLGSGLASPARGDEGDCPPPKPIPGGLDFLGNGTIYHILAPGYPPPGSNPPETNDPSVITDFNGFVGLAYVRGMGTHTDKTTQPATVTKLPFEVDLRFMSGEYIGQDGRNHHGAFALV